MKQKNKWILKCAPLLVWLYQWCVRITSRYRTRIDPESFCIVNERKPCIYAFWHGNSFMLLFSQRNKGVHLMISKSQDGDIMTACSKFLGYHSVRGSTSKGAVSALKQLVQVMRKGGSFAISPDGPRGPRYSIQPGIIYLAKKFKLPIIPAAYDARFKKCLNNWDGYMIPFPLNHIVVNIGAPVYVHDASEEESAQKLQQALHKTASACLDLLA